jgi:hypothetical protein
VLEEDKRASIIHSEQLVGSAPEKAATPQKDKQRLNLF